MGHEPSNKTNEGSTHPHNLIRTLCIRSMVVVMEIEKDVTKPKDRVLYTLSPLTPEAS